MSILMFSLVRSCFYNPWWVGIPFTFIPLSKYPLSFEVSTATLSGRKKFSSALLRLIPGGL